MDPVILQQSKNCSYRVIEEIGTHDTFRVYKAVLVPKDGGGDGDLGGETFCAVKYARMADENGIEKLSSLFALHYIEHRNLLGAKIFHTVGDIEFYVVKIPYMIGSLRSVMTSIRTFADGFPEDFILLAMRETLKGLKILHGQDVVHGEISAGRVFVAPRLPLAQGDQQSRIQLSFAASSYDLSGSGHHADLNSVSRWARAPELRGARYVPSKEGDVWLIGIMALELANGQSFYNYFSAGCWEQFVQVLEETVIKVKKVRLTTESEEKQSFLGRLWPRNPTDSSQFVELVLRCLDLDPSRRPSAYSLLGSELFRNLDDDAIFDKYGSDNWEILPKVNVAEPPTGDDQSPFLLQKNIGTILEEAVVYLAQRVEDEAVNLLVVKFSSHKKSESYDRMETLLNLSSVAENISNVLKLSGRPVVTGDHKYWCLEMIKGSLYDLVFNKYKRGMPEKSIMVIICRIFGVVSELHKMGRHHGMLCASHVYLDQLGTVKVGCGASVVDLESDLERFDHVNAWKVTEVHREAGAPEGPINSKSDVWAIGVVALELVYGGLVVSERSIFDQLVEEIVNKKNLPPKFGGGELRKETYSQKFVDLVVKCLDHEPDKRPDPTLLEMDPMFYKPLHTWQPDHFTW